MSEVSLGFIPELLSVPLDQLIFTHKVPAGLTGSFKYKQIRSSIEEVGLIEPLTIFPEQKNSNQPDTSRYLILDGLIRFTALKELGYTEVPCLVAKDDEAYTFNSRLNRLSTIQEHLMIRKAIEKGVSKESLAKALHVNMVAMKKKIALLDGICPEAADLLKDRQFTADVTRVLRKMKPTRQIACVEMMTDASTVTVSCAEALLASTQDDMLVDGEKPKKMQGVTREQMLRMETEMTNVQRRYKSIDNTIAQTTVQLVVAKGYLIKLTENKSVVEYLEQNKPEILEQFMNIVKIPSIEEASQNVELKPNADEGV